MDKDKFLGTLLAIIASISFGCIPLIANLAYAQGVSVETLLFLRFGIGSILLWVYILMKRITFRISKSHFLHLILVSIIGYTLAATTYFNAFKYIPTSLSTIIMFSYPIIIVIYEMLTTKKVDYKKFFCMITTIIGLILVVGVGFSYIKLNSIGIALAVVSAITYAYFCIGIGEKRIQKMNSIVVCAYIMGICATFYLVQCMFTGNSFLPTNRKGAILSFVMAILCGIIPIITLYLGIQKIGVGNASIIGAFEPLFVCFLGVVFLSEALTINIIFGGIIIIVSMIILQMPSKKKVKVY